MSKSTPRRIKRVPSTFCDEMVPLPKKELGGFFGCFAEYFAIPTDKPIPIHLHIYDLQRFRAHRQEITIPETITTYSYDGGEAYV